MGLQVTGHIFIIHDWNASHSETTSGQTNGIQDGDDEELGQCLYGALPESQDEPDRLSSPKPYFNH